MVGRRAGGPDTRGEILAAAREEFAVKGLAGTSLRGIARSAGVDPALVHHYFDGKDELFLVAMQLPGSPDDDLARALDVPRDQVGEALVGYLLSVWDDPGRRPVLLGLVRSSFASEEASRLFRDGIARSLVAGVSRSLPVEEAERKVPYVLTQVVGLIVARYVVRFEPLASAPAEEVVAMIGPSIQRYLDLGSA